MRLGRVTTITLSIAAIGAIIGGVLGAALLAVWALRLHAGGAPVVRIALFGARNGAALGAVLAPITAWSFLRRVPLGRALAQTAIGTTLGAAFGLVLGSIRFPAITNLPAGLFGALLGFVVAAIRLRLATSDGRASAPARSRAKSSEKL